MKRFRNTAFSTCTPLALALLAGCGQSRPGAVWDASAMTWETAPPRVIVDLDASGDGAPGSVPGMSSRGFDRLCKSTREPWCCYDGYNVAGFPLCSWRAVGFGTSVTITEAFLGSNKVTLPSPLTLTSTTPSTFSSADECRTFPVGFVLEGKGLTPGPLASEIMYWKISKEGFWSTVGGGQTNSLVTASNTDPASRTDGGASDGGIEGLPPPNEMLPEDKCAVDSGASANVVLFHWVRFTLDGKEYDANFDKQPLGPIRAYYTRIERTY